VSSRPGFIVLNSHHGTNRPVVVRIVQGTNHLVREPFARRRTTACCLYTAWTWLVANTGWYWKIISSQRIHTGRTAVHQHIADGHQTNQLPTYTPVSITMSVDYSMTHHAWLVLHVTTHARWFLVSCILLHRVQKPGKTIFVRTLSNFNQLWKLLA